MSCRVWTHLNLSVLTPVLLSCVLQSWTGPEKLLALDELIDSCEPTQVKHMMQVIEPQFQRDFISLLPKEVSPRIPPPTPFCSDISSSLVPVLLTRTLMGVPAGRHPVCDRDEASSPGLILSPSSLTSFNGIHSGCLVLLCIIFDNTNNLKCHTDDKIT